MNFSIAFIRTRLGKLTEATSELELFASRDDAYICESFSRSFPRYRYEFLGFSILTFSIKRLLNLQTEDNLLLFNLYVENFKLLLYG